MELIIFILIIAGWKLYQAVCDEACNNIKVGESDNTKIFHDRYIEGMSSNQIKRNMAHGKYKNISKETER